DATAVAAGGRRCSCGHYPTSHMRVVALPGSASFSLEPTGPCQLCGEAGCRRFAAPRPASGAP
ncbi:MAG TPA: hypothetical protein VJQ43_06565, partial [Thermoplasmata archaeon]|nr:hypothetical protein [Thermoplasmata archaeon]